MSTDILWRVFYILTDPVPYTFVSVNRRNNEAKEKCASHMYKYAVNFGHKTNI